MTQTCITFSAKLALEKLNLNVSVCYAVEKEKEATLVTKKHHPEVEYLESIEAITPEKLVSIAPFDLVVGGTPCVDLNSNLNRKGYLGTLYLILPVIYGLLIVLFVFSFFKLDLKQGGHDFLYFNDILNLVRLFNKGQHFFFLFNTSISLPTTNRDLISDLLMVCI